MPSDTITSVLMRTVMSLPDSQYETDLDLIAASAIALGGQVSMEEKKDRARVAFLRAREHLISATASDGTTLGGLRSTGTSIVLPFPPSSPDTPLSLTGKKRGPPSEIGAASESTGPSSASEMEEIGLLRTAVTPARHVNSLRVEHHYATSGALISALYRAVQISPSGTYYRTKMWIQRFYYRTILHSRPRIPGTM